MSKVSNQNDFSKITELPDLVRYLSAYINELTPIINGKIQFDDNIKSQTVEVYFDAANQDKTISHNLNKTNVGFLLINKMSSFDVYHGSISDTLSTVTLRSTVAGVTATILII